MWIFQHSYRRAEMILPLVRTFVRAYKKSLEVHEALAQNRSRFAARLYEMSEELVNLAKEGERLRKLVSVEYL
jgi:hypothetical protein